MVIAAKRPYDWRVFWFLVGLSIPAAVAILPFAMNLQAAYSDAGADIAPGVAPLIFDVLVNIILVALLGGLGLALAHRVGLRLPFVESWVNRVHAPVRFRGILARGSLAGIACGVLILFLDFQVFRQPMLEMFRDLSIKTPKEAISPPLYGFMAAISAGIIEEILFRLFGLSLLVWLIGLLIHTEEIRPRLTVFWIANITFAIVFAAAHLGTASAIGWPMNTLVLTRTFVLNSAAGIVFGWMFWAYGLESAMVAHFSTDVVLYTLLPIILLQAEKTAIALAITGVAVVIVLSVILAVRTIMLERSRARSHATVRAAQNDWPGISDLSPRG
jgi:hypothetical protein